jgi:hypothetical protein
MAALVIGGYTILCKKYDLIVPMLVVACDFAWIGYDAHEIFS